MKREDVKQDGAGGGADHLSRFIGRLHRRLILLRAIEAAGIGLLVAAALSFVLDIVLLCLGRDALPMSVVALSGGAIIGFAASLFRLPTILSAAAEADRQLGLADLLMTALMAGDTKDPWRKTVLAMADARCRTLSPSDVLLARLGARTWGGIGLSAALVVALAALSISPRDSRATAGDVEVTSSIDAIPTPQITTPTQSFSDQQSTNALSAETSNHLAPEAMDDTIAGHSAASNQLERKAANAGGGTASAMTSTNAQIEPERHNASGSPAKEGSETAGGGAAMTPTAPGNGKAAASVAGASQANQTVPAWSATTWPQDCAAAGRAVDTGKVPDAYREVLKGYFKPE